MKKLDNLTKNNTEKYLFKYDIGNKDPDENILVVKKGSDFIAMLTTYDKDDNKSLQHALCKMARECDEYDEYDLEMRMPVYFSDLEFFVEDFKGHAWQIRERADIFKNTGVLLRFFVKDKDGEWLSVSGENKKDWEKANGVWTTIVFKKLH